MTDTKARDHVENQTILSGGLRFHYMDNLRALAMMLGVFFHAAFAYMPMSADVWVMADANKSIGLEAFALFSHLFRMPLFMLVAGFFAYYLLTRRGIKGFIKNRSVRVLAPFLVFLPLVLAGIIGVVVYAAYTVENKSPMLQFIIDTHGTPEAMQGPFTTMHLWFLLNLIWFYSVALILVKLHTFSIRSWFANLSPVKINWVLLLLLPLALIPSLYVQTGSASMAPDRIYPQLWSFGFYGIFFALGWLLYTNIHKLDALERHWKWLLLVSMLAYGFAFTLYPRALSIEQMLNQDAYYIDSGKRLVIAVVHAFISVYMVLVCLILGKKLLNIENKIFRYISDSSYWVYIVHPPILMFIQVKLMDVNAGLWQEFLLASLSTLAISLLSYQLLVRYTPIGWMLNGRRKQSVSLTPQPQR